MKKNARDWQTLCAQWYERRFRDYTGLVPLNLLGNIAEIKTKAKHRIGPYRLETQAMTNALFRENASMGIFRMLVVIMAFIDNAHEAVSFDAATEMARATELTYSECLALIAGKIGEYMQHGSINALHIIINTCFIAYKSVTEGESLDDDFESLWEQMLK